MKANKWKMIQVHVSEARQIIAIDFKLPSDIAKVKGIQLMLKGTSDIAADYLPQVGELSLQLNSKQQHPLHITADYHKTQKRKTEPLMMDSETEPNQNITGFYIDYGQCQNEEGEFLPYTLSIYLECEPKKQ